MLIYLTGGARSGKSRYGVELARRLAKKVVFAATAMPTDGEMKRRIKRHREERPKHWRTLESRIGIYEIFKEIDGRAELLLFDCLTLHVSAGLMRGESESKIIARVEKFCRAAAAA